MVEIPSILWSLPSIIQKIDFLSIGTNDLTQFLFAASREDSRMDHFRMRSLPVILAIIKYIVNIAAPLQKEVIVCGEMASDPSIVPFLIGAGIRTLSVQLPVIQAVRKEIESRSLEQDIELVEEFLRNSFPGGDLPLRMSA
jgi:phosphoenolpyruvate-protein kinase (PTS system EI component)